MQTAETKNPCPCGNDVTFEKCCQPYLLGKKKAETAEKLLRSRYSAFVATDVDYILATHHPETVAQIDRAAVADWAQNSKWFGLKILHQEKGSAKDDFGVIEFVARYATLDPATGLVQEPTDHHEKSEFKKTNDNWFFYDVYKNKPIKHETPQAGRNDPCPCGSGKKFKKCCGL